MAIFKKKSEPKKNTPFEKNNDIQKLCVYITIVGPGLADTITRIFKNYGSSAQFIQRGEGTATKQIREIFGIEDTSKDIIASIVKQSSIADIKVELEAFFAANKKNKGIGFSIPMTSIAGVTVYKFLTNTL